MKRLKLTCLTLPLVTMGSAIAGQTGMFIAFALACAMNFVSYWFSDKIILKMYKAREVSELDNPTFYRMVRRLSQQGNMPMPKVYTIPSVSPNAFATGRNPRTPLWPQLRGLCASFPSMNSKESWP